MNRQQANNLVSNSGDIPSHLNGEIPEVSKIITVTLDGMNQANVEIAEEHFENFSKEEIDKIVSRVIQQAALMVNAESDSFQRDDPNLDVQKNPGGLYDNVQFESSIYTTKTDGEGSGLLVNSSFGLQCEPNLKVYTALRRASDVMMEISEGLYPAEDNS